MNTSQQAIDGAAAAVEGDLIAEVVDLRLQRHNERLELSLYRGQEELKKKEVAEAERYYKEFGESIEKQTKTLADITKTAYKMLQLARQLDKGTSELTTSMNRWKNLLEERARGAVNHAVPDSSGKNLNRDAGVEVTGYLMPQLQPLNQAVYIAIDKFSANANYAEKLCFALHRLKQELDPEMKKGTLRNAPEERLGKRQKTDSEWAIHPQYDDLDESESSDDSDDSNHR
jgi:hypothetical protein